MRLETSASESGEKDVNECMFAGKMCLTVCGQTQNNILNVNYNFN